MKINEKISALIEGMDEKQRYYVFAGALLLVFLLFYFVLMKPQLDSLSEISPKIKILEDDIVRTENNILRVPQFKEEVEKLKKDINLISYEIRSKEEVPLILENISKIANRNGVKIDQIMPITQDQEMLLEESDRRYFSLPILIEASAGYHDFGRFLNQIEAESNFLKVYSFAIASKVGSKSNVFKLTLSAIIYE